MGKRFVNLPEADRLEALNTFQAVVIEQPHKIPLLAGAIQVANGMESSIGKLCIESFHARLQDAVDKGNWNSVKLLTRFIASLYPMIADGGSGVFKLLNVLLDRAIELQNTSEKRSPLGQELYTAVLLSIPYLISSVIIADASEELKQSLKELIVKSRGFNIVEDSKAVEMLTPWTGDKKPYESKCFVELVRNVMESIAANNLIVPSMLEIPVLIEPDMPKEGHFVSHIFPAINIPESIEKLAPYKGIDYQTTRMFFSVYLPDILETVPPVQSLESVLFRDISTDIINNMDFNRKEVARQLITLDLFFGKSTFTEPGISMDRLQGLHASNPSDSTWKVEDVAMEAVLEGIFKLPKASFYGSYFHAILVESCIMAPQAIAPVFGRAIRFLYSHLTELDIELQHRFLDWFSHHLSNFGFSWKWQEWKDDVSLPEMHPRKVFMKQLILKEVRLSYPQRVKDTLPEELVEFVPAVSQEPIFKFLEPESQYQNEVHQLMDLFRESNANQKEDINNLLHQIRQSAGGNDEEAGENVNPTNTVIDIVVSTVCYLGNRSISHAESWIERTKDILLDVCVNDYTQTIESVLDYWKEQPYVGLLVVMQLIKQEILPPSEFFKTLIEPSCRGLLTTNHGWEMMLRVIDFTIGHQKYSTGSTEKTQLFNEVLELFNKLITEQEIDVTEETMEEDNQGDQESKQWALWWTKGTIRSLIRRYYLEFQRIQDVGSNIKNDYILGLLDQAKAL